jgi:hypothetical protein
MIAPYDAAIFFDNDADHIKDVYDACVHDSMVAVKVTDAPRGYRLREQTMDSPLMDEYILDNIAPDNTYVEYLRKHGGKMEYDPFSGFNVSGEKDSDMYKLTQWIMKTRPSRNTVPRGRSPSTERSSVDGRSHPFFSPMIRQPFFIAREIILVCMYTIICAYVHINSHIGLLHLIFKCGNGCGEVHTARWR